MTPENSILAPSDQYNSYVVRQAFRLPLEPQRGPLRLLISDLREGRLDSTTPNKVQARAARAQQILTDSEAFRGAQSVGGAMRALKTLTPDATFTTRAALVRDLQRLADASTEPALKAACLRQVKAIQAAPEPATQVKVATAGVPTSAKSTGSGVFDVGDLKGLSMVNSTKLNGFVGVATALLGAGVLGALVRFGKITPHMPTLTIPQISCSMPKMPNFRG